LIARRLQRLARAKWLAVRSASRGATHDAPPELEPEPCPPPPAPGFEGLPRARAILGVSADASRDAVRAGYRELCRRYHPDRFAADPEAALRATELMQEITRAYRLLDAALAEREASGL
jgi:DnaJ-domain-containing protein 1